MSLSGSRLYRTYVITVLMLALFLLTLLGGARSLTPLLWNDSTSYIASALRSITTGSLVVINGVNVGYVAILVAVLKTGATFQELVLLQKIAWGLSVLLCGYTIFLITRSRWSLIFLLLLAVYPGIQIYQNLILTESLYTTALTSALCFTLLAMASSSGYRPQLYLLAATLLAALAAVIKAQGIGPFLVIVIAVVWISGRRSRGVLVISMAGVLVAIITVLAGHQLRANSTDNTSVLFGTKTLFCAHLNLVLNNAGTQQSAERQFGDVASTIMTRLRSDLHSDYGKFTILGVSSDACQFDTVIDDLGIAAQDDGVKGLARWYSMTFFDAIREHPWQYISKVIIQIIYGLKMAVPPHGLGDTLGGVEERRQYALQLLAKSEFGACGLDIKTDLLKGPSLGHYVKVANVGLRIISLAVACALVLALVILIIPSWRRNSLSAYTILAALVWFAQIGSIAMTHTLDVWRYIIPVVPAGLLTLTLMVNLLWQQYFRGETQVRV